MSRIYAKCIHGVIFIGETPMKYETNTQKIWAKSDFIIRLYKNGICRVFKDNTGHFVTGNFTKSGELRLEDIMNHIKHQYESK